MVDDIMRSTYSLYVSHFSLLRQSSSVIFHCLYGLSLRASKRAICSSELISIQNLITMPPESTICLSNPLISSAERWYSSSVQKPSMGSTIILPYHDLS